MKAGPRCHQMETRSPIHLTSAQGPIPLKNIQLNGDTLSYEFTTGEFDVACALTRQDDGSYTGPTLRLGSPVALFDLSGYALGIAEDTRQFDVAPAGDRFLLKQPVATDGSSSDNGANVQLIIVDNWFEELKRLMSID